METFFWWNNAVLSLALPLWGIVNMVLLPNRHLRELYGSHRNDLLLIHMTRVLGITFALVGWCCYLNKVRTTTRQLETIRLFSVIGSTHNICMLCMIVGIRAKLGSPMNGYSFRTMAIITYFAATLFLEFLWTF